MAFTLGDVLNAARDRHPYFARPRVPDAVFARFFTDHQRTLLSKATQLDPTYLLQSVSIAFAVSTANAIGTVGAGTGGLLPGSVTNGVVSATEAPLGDALTVDTTNAVQLVGPTAVTSATATTLSASAAWSTNAYVGDIVEIVAGTGQGQVRSIVSNTANQLTVAAWATVPDTTSVFRIVTTVLTDSETLDVVTSFPLTTTRQGFAVKLNASGAPYLDLTTPLIATVDASLTLPAMKRLVGGTVWITRNGVPTSEPLTIVGYQNRMRALGRYVAVVAGQTLTLQGAQTHWSDVTSIELKYVPEPPAFTALTDYFLLPDSARPAVVARGAYMAGVRINGLPDLPEINVAQLAADASEAETMWLKEVSGATKSRVHRMRGRGY